MHPERLLNLNTWLAFWMENGAVPIATLNLQKGVEPMPDAWHHQMIFGVGPEGVHLTNPLECVRAEELWPQLCSEPVLMVKREDVLPRWCREEFVRLMRVRDVRWRRMNVVGEFRVGGDWCGRCICRPSHTKFNCITSDVEACMVANLASNWYFKALPYSKGRKMGPALCTYNSYQKFHKKYNISSRVGLLREILHINWNIVMMMKKLFDSYLFYTFFCKIIGTILEIWCRTSIFMKYYSIY